MITKCNLIQFCLLCAAMLPTITSEAQSVTKIAAGGYHSLFLKSDGSLWVMGDNMFGQLGDGTYNNTNLPEQIVASNVTAIAAGEYHSLFLKSDGSLWAMGYNDYGQLGDGTYKQHQPARADCGQQRHGDCRRRLPQPVSQERRQSVGHGRQRVWPVGRRHLQHSTNLPEQIVAGPPGYNQISVQLLSGGNVQFVLCGHRRSELRAGPFLQPVTGQLGAAGDQSRRRGRGAGVHQHAGPDHQQFLAHPLRAVAGAGVTPGLHSFRNRVLDLFANLAGASPAIKCGEVIRLSPPRVDSVIAVGSACPRHWCKIVDLGHNLAGRQTCENVFQAIEWVAGCIDSKPF